MAPSSAAKQGNIESSVTAYGETEPNLMGQAG